MLQFWLGDHLTSTIWMPVYLLSQNQSGLLKQFLLKPGIYTYSKTAVSEALSQTAIHHPQRRNEIASVYKEVLSYYLHAELKGNVIDSDFLGFIIGDIIDCGFTELLPAIKDLFDKEYVSVGVNGNYDEVEKYFNGPSQRKDKNKVENIFELYETILSTWAGYSEDGGYSEYDDYEDDEIPQPAVSTKIGRNDLCPCGSGKKYKKCCMNKLT